MRLHARVVVLTGAASGIGRALAQEFAARGCRLALCDVDAQGLHDTAAQLGAGSDVSLHVLDLCDREALARLPRQVLQRHGAVHVLVNNAGVALGGDFEQVAEADFEHLMQLNFHVPVRLCRLFLPHLRAAGQARVVNVSSLYGLISPPGQAAYSASKFALRGFSNALRHELAGSGVGVTVVHPGGVATSIARNARMPAGMGADEVERGLRLAERMLRMPPRRAAGVIVRGIERGAPRVLVGADARGIAWLERVMPVGYWSVLRRALRLLQR